MTINLTKGDKRKSIELKNKKLFYWFPIVASIVNGLYIDALLFLLSSIFIFPNVVYRVWLGKNANDVIIKAKLTAGWKVENREQVDYLVKKNVLHNERPSDDGRIWMTNGIIMEEVEIIAKQGFWKSMANTMIAFFKVRMYVLSIIWLLSNITGLGDFIFMTFLYTRFPRWRRTQLEKKGFRPLSEYDEKQLEKYKKKEA